MSFDYSYVIPASSQAANEPVRETSFSPSLMHFEAEDIREMVREVLG